ncbi:MAG: hypothetical protein Q8L86_06830 [Vicinamibacterales bacterium]|nr:hypothetical protein [Vicinamibacterales bacterium]
MSGRPAELVAVLALAVTATVYLAAPVLRIPSERLFGAELVGRHHDPFTVMAQFERPWGSGTYPQPVTDITGALLTRASGPVAGYNWLILFSFPLSAAAAFLLARHLTLSAGGATMAAMAYAFSPFHLAHAAYHPHIAQTQWIPLYLLALWRSLDAASPMAVGLLGAATVAVALSNLYGALIAAVITPFAVAAYWWVARAGRPHAGRDLAVTLGSLGVIATAAGAYLWHTTSPVVVAHGDAFAFPRADLFRYSAKWWGYLVPPAGHPWLGSTVRDFWEAAGVREGLLEQQVSLGWGVVALGLVAVTSWVRGDRQPAVRVGVPVLVSIAVVALVCSLSPERTVGAFTFVRPSALLYEIVPMFRSYARFGVVVQLMAVLLAGIGVDALRRAGTARATAACVALVALVVGEYAVSPSALWRDVLPTTAHRWAVEQPGPLQVLDCVPLTAESASVPVLTGGRVSPLGRIEDCREPDLPGKLAATGITHLLVRRASDDGYWVEEHGMPEGLRTVATFDDGWVFAVTAPAAAIYIATTSGLSPRESDAAWSWRWMGGTAAWTIINATGAPARATLHLEASAFHEARRVSVTLDGHVVQEIVVVPPRGTYDIGPFTVPTGGRTLAFHALEVPTVADDILGNGDTRPLSIALGAWGWRVTGAEP